MASSVVTLFYWGISFVAGITFKPFGTLLGDEYLYWVCSLVTLASLLFVMIIVPETKGKSSEEIKLYFTKKYTRY